LSNGLAIRFRHLLYGQAPEVPAIPLQVTPSDLSGTSKLDTVIAPSLVDDKIDRPSNEAE
jgi:hypothetical protein